MGELEWVYFSHNTNRNLSLEPSLKKKQKLKNPQIFEQNLFSLVKKHPL